MAELKTQKNDGDVTAFFDSIEDPTRQADARTLSALLTKVTKAKPVMWGEAIVGYGEHVLTYPNGRQLDWMVLGFSPRKAATTIYLNGATTEYADILERLGKHTAKGGCLYIKKMADVDAKVLEELLTKSYAKK
jgi:hypothetical protein